VRGDPTSGPSRSVSDDRGVGDDDAMAMATADARRAFVAAGVVVAVTAGAAVSDVVGAVDGWTCCTARLSVRCWPSRTDADTPRVQATENDLPA
jgi:hypothetical protein